MFVEVLYGDSFCVEGFFAISAMQPKSPFRENGGVLSVFGGADVVEDFLKIQEDEQLKKEQFFEWGEVKKLPGKGRGVFATADLERGQLLTCSNGLLWIHDREAKDPERERVTESDLAELLDKLNPCGMYKVRRDEVVVFEKHRAIEQRGLRGRGLYVEYLEIDRYTFALNSWPYISIAGLFNAPCVHQFAQEHTADCKKARNVELIWIKKKGSLPKLAYYAKRHIKKGEELCRTYGGEYWAGAEVSSENRARNFERKVVQPTLPFFKLENRLFRDRLGGEAKELDAWGWPGAQD